MKDTLTKFQQERGELVIRLSCVVLDLYLNANECKAKIEVVKEIIGGCEEVVIEYANASSMLRHHRVTMKNKL